MTDRVDRPSVPDRPLWYEGMLLAPQHLQQQARYADRSLRFRFAASNSFAFGVVALEIDQSALVSGLFRATLCTAVMPDGLVVDVPQLDRRSLELDFTDYAERLRVQPLRIELAIPREAGAGEQPNTDRFRSYAGNEEVDASAGAGSIAVAREVPNAVLRVADRPTAKFTTLPLAEVALRDEAFTLTDYVPPRLQMAEDHPLSRELAGLTRRVREKAVYISERARSHRSRSAHDAAENLRIPLKALSEHLPEMEAMLSSGSVHPFEIYLGLCRLSGCMTALSNFAVPPQGRGYRHDEIRRSYRHHVDFITGCLDQIRQEFTVVAFEQTENGFQLDLKTQMLRHQLIVAAQVAPGISPDATWDWVEESLIATPERLDDLRRRRTLGAPRRLLERDEAIGYTLASDTVLFTVELDGTHLSADDTIEIVNTAPEKADAKPIQLYAYVSTEGEGKPSGGAS